MATVGQEYKSFAGERMVFQATAQSTKGEYIRFDTYLPATSLKPPPHLHPKQSEVIHVVAGQASATINGHTEVCQAGQTITIPQGATHVVWNSGNSELHIDTEMRPALNSEGFFEGLMQLDGKNPLLLAVLIGKYKDEVAIPFPFNLVIGLMGAIGKLMGYQA